MGTAHCWYGAQSRNSATWCVVLSGAARQTPAQCATCRYPALPEASLLGLPPVWRVATGGTTDLSLLHARTEAAAWRCALPRNGFPRRSPPPPPRPPPAPPSLSA